MRNSQLPPRLFLSFVVVAAASVACGDDRAADSVIWFDQPAEHFTESLPLGNGRLGAMWFGGVEQDKIVLCESGMWSGSEQDENRHGAAAALPEIRELLFAGKVHEAERLMNQQFTCAGAGSGHGRGANVPYGSYQTLGTLLIDYQRDQRDEAAGQRRLDVTQYRRYLMLDRATAQVSVNPLSMIRKAFVSAPDQVLVYRISAADRGGASFRVRLSRPEHAEVAAEGDDQLVMMGQLPDGRGGDAGVRYCARVRVIPADGDEGVVTVADGALQVRGVRSAMILVAAATKIDSFAGRDMADPAAATGRDIDAAADRTFVELQQRHVDDYQRYYNRAALVLGPPRPRPPASVPPTPARLKASWNGAEDPDLAALYFNFGRYLLISSSRPGGFPANLQGIWAEEIQTPWNGDWHLNVNVQMNYWPAEPCGLSDLHEPMFAFIDSLVEPGGETARAYYDADGWVAHVLANPWGFTAPGESATWGATSTGGAWACQHLWQHYLYTQDREFLARAYPALRGAAEFFLDVLVEDPRTGHLVTAPSNSPENTYVAPDGQPAHICIGATMDMQVIRYLFDATVDAAEILGVDESFGEQLRASRARLRPTQIGSDGRIMEWDREYQEAEPHHRHVSHLWGLYPASEIDARLTPELAAAARKSLDARGDDGTGWSLAYKIALWARLHDGDRALKLLKRQLMPVSATEKDIRWQGGTYPNLFDSHPPFQIDGNFGATAAIAEMLLQSRATGTATAPSFELDLLPALPTAWPQGSYRGLRGRGGFVVDAKWADGELTQAQVVSQHGLPVIVRCGERTAELELEAGESVLLDGQLQILQQAAEAAAGSRTE